MTRSLTFILIALCFTTPLAIAEDSITSVPEVSQVAPAEPIAQCARLVHGCYGEVEGQTRANCLFSSAKHPFCEGTQLGKLTYQRWIMSPTRSGGAMEEGPSFLGPKLVNQECLKGFDTFFVSSLVNADEVAGQLNSLTERLSSCNRETAPALPRP